MEFGVQNKTALVTGASGFLGTWLADAAKESGLELLGMDLRAPSKPQLWADFATGACETLDFEQFWKQRKVDLIFHLAGGASVPASVRDPFSDFASLLPGTAKLLSHAVRSAQRPHLIFFSSAAVYGNPETLPISEDHPLGPISPYGIHKATAETLLQRYSRAFELPVSILRIFSAYGPGLRKQLFWDAGQRAIQAASRGEGQITLFGTGRETRDFIYAGEVARAAIAIAQNPPKTGFQVLNVASGVETTIADVSKELIARLGLNLSVRFDGRTRAGDPCNWHADVSRLRALGFRNKLDTAYGIKQVADWMNASKQNE